MPGQPGPLTVEPFLTDTVLRVRTLAFVSSRRAPSRPRSVGAQTGRAQDQQGQRGKENDQREGKCHTRTRQRCAKAQTGESVRGGCTGRLANCSSNTGSASDRRLARRARRIELAEAATA